MDRESIRQHMMGLFDIHFRPSLQRLSPNARRVLIFGPDAISPTMNRDQLRLEISNFLEEITNSGEAAGVLDPHFRQESSVPRQNIEE